MFNRKLKEQLAEARRLVASLDSFVYIAEIERPNSEAIKYTRTEIDNFYRKYGE